MKVAEQVVPELSVVIVVLVGKKNALAGTLSALSGQRGVTPPEVIVACDESSRDVMSLSADCPSARFLCAEARRTYAELRSLGVRSARGRVIALTEDHCLPAPDWCARILDAHRRHAHAAIGGAVEKDAPDRALNWAFYLADYLRYASPFAEGPADSLTDCNVTYKREALSKVADVWAEEFHEPEIHAALRARGELLWLTPQIVVRQRRSLSLGAALRDRYAFGRLFGGTRVARAPLSRRLFHAALAPALPLLLVWRVARLVMQKRRYGAEFVRALPQLLLISTVWACGEALGYVTGRAGGSLTPRRKSAGAAGSQVATT